MTVAELQQYFENLARVIRAAPAAKAADELEHIARGLSPFRSMSLKDFAEFLVRAEEFARTGQVSAAPVKVKARSAAASTRAAKPKLDAAAIAHEAKRLYDLAATASVTDADLQALADNLAHLKKDGLRVVCDAIGLIVKKSATIPEILRGIRAKIEGRQGSKQRSGMTSLPSSSPAGANGAETFASAAGIPV